LGDGGWGTTLAIHLHRRGHRVRWWSAFPEHARLVARRRENVRYLPGVPIPKTLPITADLAEAVDGAEGIVVAIPSQHLRGIVRRLTACRAPNPLIVNVAKGLERTTMKRMSEIVRDELGAVPYAVLSGPNIAREIANGQPASSVAAATRLPLATCAQRWFASPGFRVYTSTDVIGVELGGALKNPMAIAAGIGDGLGFGANAKAALISRGIVEMARLGRALGAREETFWGLSGLGDLITTCLGGRNRWLGEQIGRGHRLSTVLAGTPMVIEGVETTRAAVALARRHHVELPIIEQVFTVLFRRTPPRQALKALMIRAGKREFLPRG